jgi:hypothetical protein
MKALRVIILTGLLFFLAGGAFAENNRGGRSQGRSYAAPDFDFSGPMKTELLLVVVGAALLLARRRRGRAVSQTHLAANKPRDTAKVREVAGTEGPPEDNRSFHPNARAFVDSE